MTKEIDRLRELTRWQPIETAKEHVKYLVGGTYIGRCTASKESDGHWFVCNDIEVFPQRYMPLPKEPGDDQHD